MTNRKWQFGKNGAARKSRVSRKARLGVESLEERAMLAVFTVTNALDAGPGSLRDAIQEANALAGPDDIEFDIAGPGPHTIQPNSALPSITEDLSIDGFTQPGAVANTADLGMPSNATFQIEIDGSSAGATDGLIVDSGSVSIRGLVINRFALSGIRLNTGENVVSDNFIGTDVTGQSALGNGLDGVQVSRSAENEIRSNLLSGNQRDGVLLFFPSASFNIIEGNFIGTNRDGTTDLGNAACGVEVVGGSENLIRNNLISGNDEHGVRIGSEAALGNMVTMNRVGTDVTGALGLGNADAGVEVEDALGSDIVENVIAFNGESGVNVFGDPAVGNRISRNSMFQNAALGIDLGDDGVTPNDVGDPDLGPNILMNFPEIVDVNLDGGNVEITYSVPTIEANASFPLDVEFFIADVDNQEGEIYLGTDSYLIPGLTTATFPAGGLVEGDFVVGTATDTEEISRGGFVDNTSEFSEPAMIPIPDGGDNDTIETATVLGSPPVVTINDDSVGEGDEDYFKYTAHHTGKLIVNALFTHEFGDIDLEVVDMSGNVIASSTSMDDNEGVVIPVVTQEMYFIHVFSADDVLNTYDLEIENFAAPVPSAVLLDPASDTGMMNNDGVTADTTPTLLVQADLSGFASMGINLLDAAAVAAGTVQGVGVEVTLVNSDTGDFATAFASPVGFSGTLWTLTSPILTPGSWLLSAASYVVDGQDPNADGRTVQSAPTWITIITEAAGGTDPQLLESSDAGMLNNDNVTNINEPAFTGTGAPWAKVDLFATKMDTGTTNLVGSTTANGDGLWEITSEPLADGVYDFTVNYTNLAGGVASSTATRVYIDTVQPNTPFLDLLSDTGRHDADNITNDNTLTLSVTANDTVDGGDNPFPNDIKYRVYVRPDGNAGLNEILLVDSFADLGDFTTDGFFTHVLGILPDGVHDFKLEVEDRAGNISEDYLLDVTIDTDAPFKSFGLPGELSDGLSASSDTGVTGQPLTFIDNVTSDTAPTFWGFAEADSIVRAFVLTDVGLVQIGQTVAQPYDGNQALPEGNWQITSNVNLSTLEIGEGLQTIVITAEDVSGNVSEEMELQIIIDTLGPRVTSVIYPDGRSVFGPKPSDGPSPLTDSLIVTLFDAGPDVAGVNPQLALDPSTYQVVGDHNGVLLIESIDFVSSTVIDGGVDYVVQINLADPIPDDRLTLRIFDSLSDDAGNALDGDLRSEEPGFAAILLPSGDGVPGGDFHARFTMDARPEIGTWSGGSVYVDTNGNFTFDPENADDTNEDIVYTFGFTSDDIFAGNFGNEEFADGFDKLAAYGDIGNPGEGVRFRWLIDLTNDGVPDLSVLDPANINGLPFAGNFDDDDGDGDEVGVFDGNTWWFDTTGDYRVDTSVHSTIRGYPMVGDFDGDNVDDLGTYNEQHDRFEFDLADNGFGTTDRLIYFEFPGVRERPLAADMNQDGIDDIGLWAPDRSGVTPGEGGEWYFLLSQPSIEEGPSLFSRVTTDLDTGLPTIEFRPEPFGNDLFAQFGDEFALPVVGNFDPPVGDLPDLSSMTNSANPLDVNDDTIVAPLDALVIINMMGDDAAIQAAVDNGMYPDVNEDGQITPQDVLMIINHMAQPAPVQAPLSAGVGDYGSEFVGMTDRDGDSSSEEADPMVSGATALATPGDDEDTSRSSQARQTPMEEILNELAEDVVQFWN